MKRRVLVCAIVAAVAAFGGAVGWGEIGGRSEEIAASQPTVLAQIMPDGSTPLPPPTPIPALAGATLISADQARAVFLNSEPAPGESVDTSSVEVIAGTAGEWMVFGYANDYPVMRVSGTGAFYPRSWACCTQMPEFGRKSLFVDAATGRVLGMELSEPHRAPSP